MIDETMAQEIQAEVDGETLPEESARVRELIARDAEAAALYEELKELAEMLDGLPPEQVPQSLRGTIVGSAAWRARAEETRKRRQLATASAGMSRVTTKKEGVVKGKYVIAGLAAAGIAAFVFYFGGNFPPKSDEAAGTIGAVKKHRVEQIAEGDVVLGTTASDSYWVPFAEFIGDAGAFGSFSSRLDAISRSLAAKDALDAKSLIAELRALDASLEARSAQLQARGLQALLLQAKQLEIAAGAASKLEAKNAVDFDRVQSTILQAKDLSAQLQARAIDFAGASSKLGALSRELAAAAKLDASTLDARSIDASSKLEALSRSLEAKGSLDAKSLRADLGAISATLAARTVELAARNLDARNTYIDLAARVQTDLAGAREQLGALARQLEASSKLDAKSIQSLNERAATLQARGAELEQNGLVGMRGQMELAAKNHDLLMGMKNNVELAARSLESRNAELGARDALAAFSQELGAKSLVAASSLMATCRNDIGAVERTLNARDAAFGAKTLDAMNTHLGALNRTLESRASQLGAKELQGLEQQLGSLSRTLQARTPDAQ